MLPKDVIFNKIHEGAIRSGLISTAVVIASVMILRPILFVYISSGECYCLTIKWDS